MKNRRIPRHLAEECFRVVAGDSIRRPVSVEFDVLTWKGGIALPALHPETELVPDPTGPRFVLEVLAPTTWHGGLFGGVTTHCIWPVFIPAVFEPSEFRPGEHVSYWSAITCPRHETVLQDRAGLSRARVNGSWRIWRATTLTRALEHFKYNGREQGHDNLCDNIREAMSWLRE
jgi:hypothetical protein